MKSNPTDQYGHKIVFPEIKITNKEMKKAIEEKLEKRECIECGKYPAEEAQTWCEFCMGISPTPTVESWREEFREKAKNDWLIWSVVENGEYAEDRYTPLSKEDFYEEIEAFITNALNQQREKTIKEILNKWNSINPLVPMDVADFYKFLTKLEEEK